MNYAFKMIAVVFALGVLVLQGCQTGNYSSFKKSYKYDFNNYAVGSTGTKEIQDFYRRNNYELVSNKSDIDKSINAYDNPIKTNTKNIYSMYSDKEICERYKMFVFKSEAKRRGLDCGVNDSEKLVITNSLDDTKLVLSDNDLCRKATDPSGQHWSLFIREQKYVNEAKKKGLNCIVNKSDKTYSASESEKKITQLVKDLRYELDMLGNRPIFGNSHRWWKTKRENIIEKYQELIKEVKNKTVIASNQNEQLLKDVNKEIKKNKKTSSSTLKFDDERKKRLEEERKRKELERKLAALEAKQKQEKQRIDTDTKVPLLEIISNNTKGKRGTITGFARDNVEVAEVTVDGKPIYLSSNGNFKYSTFVPLDGITLNIQVTDVAGLTSSKSVSLQRNDNIVSTSISFDRLNPLGKRVKANSNGLALIVGVEGYENTNADAIYADKDAKMFRDYAAEKLGIPENRIKTLLNDKAEYAEILLTTKDWLRRASKANKSDIYIFFAGHGLASDDGKDMFLLPYDGRPRLLNDTALLRDRLFKEIQQANPRSVTVFLDTCYSGTTRGTDMLIASRPIAIRAIEQSIPNNFTVFSAAAGDQTSKPLEEAKHGMFSYFLMKGMEGDADANNDNKITAHELHVYVEQNVVQQSSGSQTPELQGDKDRVLVQFN